MYPKIGKFAVDFWVSFSAKWNLSLLEINSTLFLLSLDQSQSLSAFFTARVDGSAPSFIGLECLVDSSFLSLYFGKMSLLSNRNEYFDSCPIFLRLHYS